MDIQKNRDITEQKHASKEEIAELKSEGLDHTIIESSIYKLKASLKELKGEEKTAVVITPSKLDMEESLDMGSRRKKPRLAKLQSSTTILDQYPRREIENGKVVVHSTKKVFHMIPPPVLKNKLYTHREFVVIYYNLEKQGVQSLKTLVKTLNKMNMLVLSYPTVLKMVKKYRDAQDSIEKEQERLGSAFDVTKYDDGLPPITQTVAPTGAPKKRNTTVEEAANAMNSDAHRNMSKATNPMEDAENFLMNDVPETERKTASDSNAYV